MRLHLRLAPLASRLRARLTPLALLALALAGGMVADAQGGPVVGGEVPSVLSLSLGQPSGFVRTRAGGGEEALYTARLQVAVTATEVPVSLSLADGEAIAGACDGHLVDSGRILSPALQAAVGHGSYSSLDAGVAPVLRQWRRPLADRPASIRLRQAFSGGAGELARYHKTLLVTVTVAGP